MDKLSSASSKVFPFGSVQAIALNILIGAVLSAAAVGMFIGAARTDNTGGKTTLAILGLILYFIGGIFLFSRTGQAIANRRNLPRQ